MKRILNLSEQLLSKKVLHLFVRDDFYTGSNTAQGQERFFC